MRERYVEFEATDPFTCQSIIILARSFEGRYLMNNVLNFTKGELFCLGYIGSLVQAVNSISYANWKIEAQQHQPCKSLNCQLKSYQKVYYIL